MIFFTNFISVLNVIISLIKVIVSWPTAVVSIALILRKDISKIVDKLTSHESNVKDLSKISNIELKSEKKIK